MKRRFLVGIMAAVLLIGCGSTNETQATTSEEPLEEVSQTVEESEENIENVYPDGRAMLEPPGGDAAVAGFVEYIRENGLFDEDEIGYGTDAVYKLIYLDADDVPELIYGGCLDGVHAASLYIRKYQQFGVTAEDIVKSGPYGCYNTLEYIPYWNVIRTTEPGHMGVSGMYYSRVNEFGEYERLAYEEEYYPDDDYEQTPDCHYYIGADEREVDQEEFSQFIDNITGGNEFVYVSTYENEEDYHYLDEEALNNNLYADEFFAAQK